MGKSIFWDIGEALSYNCLYNFIVGERGVGKSYGTKKHPIKKAIEDIENPEIDQNFKFGYVRRYKEELKSAMDKFFEDLIKEKEFSNYEFKTDGLQFKARSLIYDELTEDGKEITENPNRWYVIGEAFVLSTSILKKSNAYPKVDFIIFDEFIIPRKGHVRYLNDEVKVFLDLYETIARMRDVKVFFLANSISWVNPYFVKLKITPPKNKKMIKAKNDILIQITQNEAYRTAKNQTRFIQMLKNNGMTDYVDYAVNNQFVLDSNEFILKNQPKKSRYLFTLKYISTFYGVWYSQEEGKLWVSTKYEPSCKTIYTTILEDHTINTILLKGGMKASLFDKLIKCFKLGVVYYDNITTKTMILEVMSKTNKI